MFRALWLALAVAGCTKAEASLPERQEPAQKPTPAPALSTTPPLTRAAPNPAAARAVTSPPAADDVPRVYAKTRFVWIRPEPNAELQWIGYLWTGGSVKLKRAKPYYGPGCETWYAIEPRGFVCVDGRRATLDAKDPLLEKIAPYVPNLESPWPHLYGESIGLEREKPGLAPFDFGATPPGFHDSHARLKPRSTVAYSREAVLGDQTFLMTADFMAVHKDRMTPYPVVQFEGVELGADMKLPLAFFRGKDRPKYRLTADGFESVPGEYARLSNVALTGQRATRADRSFLETRDGVWIDEKDAVVPTPGASPWGDRPAGSGPEIGAPASAADRTWIEVSVWDGWLIAYRGMTPVYTTMISAGRGGTPVPGKDPLETASTPTGIFPISGKFATATMVAPHDFIHSDVPWTQNFSGPHALHGAYWHDDWGNRKSAGCVNVSPKDGRWLYDFTEPKVPEGWHGVRWIPKAGPATVMYVHK